MEKKFTVYWKDGTKEFFEGPSASKALTAAGYSNGAVSAVDFIVEGEDNSYVWVSNNESKNWTKKGKTMNAHSTVKNFCSGVQIIRFFELYPDKFGHVVHVEDTQEDLIILADNFTPTDGESVKVDCYLTKSGTFTLNKTKYRLVRATDPRFDKNGHSIEKVADVVDIANHRKSGKFESPFAKLKSILPKQVFWTDNDFEFVGVDSKLPGLPKVGDVVVMPCNVYEDGSIEPCKVPKFDISQRGAYIIKMKKGLKSRPTSHFVATSHDNGFVGFCALEEGESILKVTAFEITDVFVGSKKYCLLHALFGKEWRDNAYQSTHPAEVKAESATA